MFVMLFVYVTSTTGNEVKVEKDVLGDVVRDTDESQIRQPWKFFSKQVGNYQNTLK